MDTLAEWTLSNVMAYGIPALLLVAYLGSLGIPFPVTLVIMAAGALTRAGIFDWHQALPACLAGAMLADNSEYLLGRMAQPWLSRRFGQKAVWQQALTTLNRHGIWAILLTRFWLTPLAPAINILAGGRYTFRRFLLIDLVGQLLWVTLYGGLGYIFAAQWEWVSQVVGGITWISVAGVLLAYGLFFFFQQHRRQKAAVGEGVSSEEKVNRQG
ncbi:MAG: DedA family protein [Chloroflexi bacterium]|nr:DedA family protein [Chloroflexota bacterium]